MEAFLEGGWWEVEVLEAAEGAAAEGPAAVISVEVGGQENEVALTDVRVRVRWVGGDGSVADWQQTTEAALAGTIPRSFTTLHTCIMSFVCMQTSLPDRPCSRGPSCDRLQRQAGRGGAGRPGPPRRQPPSSSSSRRRSASAPPARAPPDPPSRPSKRPQPTPSQTCALCSARGLHTCCAPLHIETLCALMGQPWNTAGLRCQRAEAGLHGKQDGGREQRRIQLRRPLLRAPPACGRPHPSSLLWTSFICACKPAPRTRPG